MHCPFRFRFSDLSGKVFLVFFMPFNKLPLFGPNTVQPFVECEFFPPPFFPFHRNVWVGTKNPWRSSPTDPTFFQTHVLRFQPFEWKSMCCFPPPLSPTCCTRDWRFSSLFRITLTRLLPPRQPSWLFVILLFSHTLRSFWILTFYKLFLSSLGASISPFFLKFWLHFRLFFPVVATTDLFSILLSPRLGRTPIHEHWSTGESFDNSLLGFFFLYFESDFRVTPQVIFSWVPPECSFRSPPLVTSLVRRLSSSFGYSKIW